MRSPNRIIIASAGSGKTTRIVTEAAEHTLVRSALITYTNNNTFELRAKAHASYGLLPSHMKVSTWYSFLLHHFVRPYQRALYVPRIEQLVMVNGRSAPFAKESDTERHYFLKPGHIYLDKISKFATVVIDRTSGAPLRRIEQIFDHLYIDEVQDLAAWDIDLVEQLLNSSMAITMVGDIRQATYSTNQGAKHSQLSGPRIIGKFQEWEKLGLATIEYQAVSRRCVQEICAFADAFYPDLPKAQSLNAQKTGHDGVFAVRQCHVDQYIERFKPQTLQLRQASTAVSGHPINFGAAKGMTFDRVLIFPHKGLLEVIRTGNVSKLGNSDETRAKVYVGVTRARQSVGIVIPDVLTPAALAVYEP
jgi:DNA helicase II / ATP-dependent DNA helicase PcrA